jgi:hypothetical protein
MQKICLDYTSFHPKAQEILRRLRDLARRLFWLLQHSCKMEQNKKHPPVQADVLYLQSSFQRGSEYVARAGFLS